MKKLILAGLGAVAVAMLFATPARAAYTCGTGWTLYRAPSGIRCVKRSWDAGVGNYVWYGEGAFSNGKYRHIGWVSWDAAANQYRGSVVDIVGGGATFDNFIDGTFAIEPTSLDYPDSMYATTWGETWKRVSWNTAYDYTSTLTDAPTDCGPRFRNGSSPKLAKFRAYDQGDSPTSASTGVRCALRVTAPFGKWNVWYGAGSWRSRASEGNDLAPVPWGAPQRYAHVGFRSSSSAYSQYDLCQGMAFCHQRYGTLKLPTVFLPQTGNGHELSGGGLRELWIPSRAERSMRLLAYQVSDTDGTTKKTPVTTADLRAYVQAANEIYRPHGVEVLFNGWMPPGYRDLDTLADTLLNRMVKAGGPFHRRAATFYAEQTPTRAVVFLTWGPDPCPARGGASGTNQNFMNVSAPDRTSVGCGLLDYHNYGEPDSAHFAHELGHYLGLAHTFAYDHLATVADARKLWLSEGCAAGLFDGDGLASTSPDVNLSDHLSDLSAQLVSFLAAPGTCKEPRFLWAVYPRTNIMSYLVSDRAYWGPRTGDCSLWAVDTTTGSYRNCKQITAEQGELIRDAVIHPDIEQWKGQFDDFIGKSRWWRLE